MKRLVRSRSNRKVAGVLAGLAEYMNADPALVRVAFVLLLIFTGLMPFALVYLVSVFLIPNEEEIIR